MAAPSTIQVVNACNGVGTPIESLGDLGPGVTEPDRLDIGYLPCDVNQDHIVSPFDLLEFRLIVNACGLDCTADLNALVDTNRDEAITPFDLLTFRQLVNGTDPATFPWAGKTMNNPQP